MKKLIISLVLLFSLVIGLNAQNLWSGFTAPNTKSTLSAMYQYHVDRGGISSFIEQCKFRPAMSVNGLAIEPRFSATELSSNGRRRFDRVDVNPFAQAGLGISFEHYKAISADSIMYPDYSIDLLITIAPINDTNAGIFLGFSAFNLWGLKPSIGLGLKFINREDINNSTYYNVPFWGLMYGGFNLRYEF